ncbi:MAG: hypothetical protein A2252_08395 [Elusimicrobia bacterium RIFOXYA2_FULL_39_19]|nr:MAG: hypothetical protein A2252_08395 [Elusimicrobia bacterium RIFOXYA2_FULL_39_19]
MRGNKLFNILDYYAGIPLIFAIGLVKHLHSIPKPQKPQTILITKLSALGDTVLLIPALRELKKAFPSSKINFIVTSINKEIAQKCPYVDNVIEFKVSRAVKNPLYLLNFILQLRKLNPDVAIDADQWLRVSAILSFLSGAKKLIGFNTQAQHKHFLFTHTVPHIKKRHEIECFLDLIRQLDIKATDNSLEYWINTDEDKQAIDILKSFGVQENDKYLVIHPEVPLHREQKQWPEEKFAELIEKLADTKKIKILITGTTPNNSLKNRLKNMDYQKLTRVVFMPKLSIGVYASVLKHSKLLLCNNTGIMHLACALNIPVIGLHGSISTEKWGPVGQKSITIKADIDCSPCIYLGFEYNCNENKCMNSINTSEVLNNINSILK